MHRGAFRHKHPPEPSPCVPVYTIARLLRQHL